MKKCEILCIIFIAVLLISGCKEDSTSPTPTQEEVNKIFFNGAGYNNVSAFPYLTAGVYNSGTNRMGMGFYCMIGSDTVALFLYFPGQSTGTFPWQTADNYALFFKSSVSTLYYNSVNSGTTVVTGCSGVGQKIEGNFSGKLNTHSVPYDTISVSCNKFSVTRSMK